jgi:HAD superfamily hydrolase (TIGR01509 family)
LPDINAIVFDMDGLLLDSEKIALETFTAACREHHFEPDLKIYFRCVGTTAVKTREILLEGYGPDFPFEKVYALWGQKFHQETWDKPIPLKPGAVSLLQYLEILHLPKALVTSTRQEVAVRELAHTRLLPFFEFVIGGDNIRNGKPHPEIYLTACTRLHADPSLCLALEDSNNGVLSAYRAGLQVIQVTDLLEPSPEVRALGHRIVKSLTEVEDLLRQGEFTLHSRV